MLEVVGWCRENWLGVVWVILILVCVGVYVKSVSVVLMRMSVWGWWRVGEC